MHLDIIGTTWCDDDGDSTDDPRDATCTNCLRAAASYGAAAAMRYAAVESGATRDPELVRERDEALKHLNAICDALEGQKAFFCTGCLKLYATHQRKLSVGSMSWCYGCAPSKATT